MTVIISSLLDMHAAGTVLRSLLTTRFMCSRWEVLFVVVASLQEVGSCPDHILLACMISETVTAALRALTEFDKTLVHLWNFPVLLISVGLPAINFLIN